MACLQYGFFEAVVKEMGLISLISTSKARGVGVMSGGILLGLCMLFLDRVIMGCEFCCSKLGSSREFGFNGRHESSSCWFGGKDRSFGKRLGCEM
jgi:hypothetical protein